MNLLKAMANRIPVVDHRSFVEWPAQQPAAPFPINNQVSIYPYDDSGTYIGKGYNKNAWVYAIVSKCAKKFGQVPWYHYRLKKTELKTWEEYGLLTKNGNISDTKTRIELRKMRTKSIDQVKVDSRLQQKLNKPNRNQTGANFREQLYGYKLLSGEGNIWLNRGEDGAVLEYFIIPKPNLALVKGGDALADIQAYKLVLGGFEKGVEKDSIIMWRFPNYDFDPVNLGHLRGQSPLDAGLLLLQSSNEAAERMINMNKNQGVAGLAYRRDGHQTPTPQQALSQRQQFNSIVNDKDLAGTIAVMNGEWGYIQFGLDAGQLKLMEQTDVHFKALCNIFDVPWQLFGNADSYENRKQYKRDFVYDNIAPACYGLRDELNEKLIPEFNLDRERDVIDADVLALPELGEDLNKQAEFLEKAGGRLSYDEGRELLGYDRLNTPEMQQHYVSASLSTLEGVNAGTGEALDNEVNLLEGNDL